MRGRSPSSGLGLAITSKKDKNMENTNTTEIKNDYTLAPWQVDNIKCHGDCFFEFTLSQRFMTFLKFAGKLFNQTVSEILQTIIACSISQEALQVWYKSLAFKALKPDVWFLKFGRIPYVNGLDEHYLKYNIEWFMTHILHYQLIQLIELTMNSNKDSFMGIPFSSVDYKKMGIWYKGPTFYEAILSASFNKYAAQFDLGAEPEHIFVVFPKPNQSVNILVDFPDGSENYLNKKFLIDRHVISLEKEGGTHSFVKFEDFNLDEFSDRFEPIRSIDQSIIQKMREAEEWRFRGMTKAQINDFEVSNSLLSYTSDVMYKRVRINGADYKKAFNSMFPLGKSAISPNDEDIVEIFQVYDGPITTTILH